jgi:hypothetical protein
MEISRVTRRYSASGENDFCIRENDFSIDCSVVCNICWGDYIIPSYLGVGVAKPVSVEFYGYADIRMIYVSSCTVRVWG